MDQDKTIKFEDIIKIIKRRRLMIIVTLLTVFLLSVLIVVVWTPVYRSSSTILIEDQDISRDYVTSIITSYADQRLQTNNQRIMSASRLMRL